MKHFWDIKDALQSLDDSQSRFFELEIKPSVSCITYMRAEAYETECKYSIDYIVKKKDSIKNRRMESTDLRSIIDQFSRVYKDGKAPLA